MPVGTRRVSCETGGLTDGLHLVQFGEESAGSSSCMRSRVDGLRCVELHAGQLEAELKLWALFG
jgi:hypothetical protein